jgi:hypothetical protein
MNVLLQAKSSIREESLPALGFEAERGTFLGNRKFVVSHSKYAYLGTRRE